jgi:hypothetical protein
LSPTPNRDNSRRHHSQPANTGEGHGGNTPLEQYNTLKADYEEYRRVTEEYKKKQRSKERQLKDRETKVTKQEIENSEMKEQNILLATLLKKAENTINDLEHQNKLLKLKLLAGEDLQSSRNDKGVSMSTTSTETPTTLQESTQCSPSNTCYTQHLKDCKSNCSTPRLHGGHTYQQGQSSILDSMNTLLTTVTANIVSTLATRQHFYEPRRYDPSRLRPSNDDDLSYGYRGHYNTGDRTHWRGYHERYLPRTQNVKVYDYQHGRRPDNRPLNRTSYHGKGNTSKRHYNHHQKSGKTRPRPGTDNTKIRRDSAQKLTENNARHATLASVNVASIPAQSLGEGPLDLRMVTTMAKHQTTDHRNVLEPISTHDMDLHTGDKAEQNEPLDYSVKGQCQGGSEIISDTVTSHSPPHQTDLSQEIIKRTSHTITVGAPLDKMVPISTTNQDDLDYDSQQNTNTDVDHSQGSKPEPSSNGSSDSFLEDGRIPKEPGGEPIDLSSLH